MLKPWSIYTIMRNPDRLRDFLSVLVDIEGEEWNYATQTDFQIRLIHARLYWIYSSEFYHTLPKKYFFLVMSYQRISYKQAQGIFEHKNYKNPAMRGRQFLKELEIVGLATVINGKVYITKIGKSLLAESKDYGHIFRHIFLKWQLPNPLQNNFSYKDGYDIKPFVGALHLINVVDKLSAKTKSDESGLSYDEFKIFALTLINWRDIDKTAEDVLHFRSRFAKIDIHEQVDFIKKAVVQYRPNFDMRKIDDLACQTIDRMRMTHAIFFPIFPPYRMNLSPTGKSLKITYNSCIGETHE